MLQVRGTHLGWKGATLLDGGTYHHSHFHNKKENAAYRIHDLQGVTEAEEGRAGTWTWDSGSEV